MKAVVSFEWPFWDHRLSGAYIPGPFVFWDHVDLPANFFAILRAIPAVCAIRRSSIFFDGIFCWGCCWRVWVD